MFTTDNYFKQVKEFDFDNMPDAIREGHAFIVDFTDNGANWEAYHESDSIKEMVNIYFTSLQKYLAKNAEKPDTNKSPINPPKVATSSSGKKAPEKKTISKKKAKAEKKESKTEVERERLSVKYDDIKKMPVEQIHREISNTRDEEYYAALMKELESREKLSLVERLPDEIRFIKRFINLDGKTKSKEEVLRFINSLQKAIVEKRIRKTSAYAEQIRFIQDSLIVTYNTMKAKIPFELKPETYDKMKGIAGGEKVLPAINFIKRYIGMNGKKGIKEKAKLLLTQVDKAYEKGKINSQDPYALEMEAIKKNLREFLAATGVKTLDIEVNQLRGLNGILSGCACQSLNGPEDLPQVMNSMDFANMEFKTLGLKGKWLDLIGDPSSNFTAMIFGKPKMGKSYLAVDFAGYLARNHGKVLYVAKEEGLDLTLQEKLNDKNVKHPNLYVASILPDDIALYDFIFLDSVSRLGLAADDLRRLKALHPNKSFIYIFQSTKAGNFKGENGFQHDVDVVIEVPEKGRATQMGRFNQGGEMEIFDMPQAA